MSQQWVYDEIASDFVPIRVSEVEATPSGEGEIVVSTSFVAFSREGSFEGCKTGDVVRGPVVGVVKHSTVPSFAVGEWVYAIGPWQTEFNIPFSRATKINTLLDDPLDYLEFLNDDVVRLFSSVRSVECSNQSAACVFGSETTNGRLAVTLLNALGYRTLALTESTAAAERVKAQGLIAEWILSAESNDFCQQAGVDRLTICIDCQGRDLSEICQKMMPEGLLVSWAKKPSSLSSLDLLANKELTVQVLRTSEASTARVLADRAHVRALFRRYPVVVQRQIVQGFDQLAQHAAEFGSSSVIVQVGGAQALPQTPLPELSELAARLAEIQESKRTVQDAQLATALRNRDVEIRKQIRDIEQAAVLSSQADSRAPAAVAEEKFDAPNTETKDTAPARSVRVAIAPGARFTPIDTFAWDQGEYNSPTVTIYVELVGVGAVKSNVSCHFERDSFDLTVLGLNGTNYRLFKDNLEKDIIPTESKYIVKANKIVVKLRKVKGEYNYEHWNKLTGRGKKSEAKSDKDPMGGIMDMMKDMYQDGDDQTKRIIGEAMMKAQRGERDAPPKFDDF